MKKTELLFITEVAVWIGVTLGIIMLSLVSGSSVSAVVIVHDKIGHLIAYAVLGFYSTLLFLRFPFLRRYSFGLSGSLAFVYCTLLGGALEFLQSLTGRHPDVRDFLADAGGALIGIMAAWIITRFWILVIKPQRKRGARES